MKVGDYWAMCCIEDLEEVKTEQDLAEANHWEAEEPEEPIGLRVWGSREEALKELVPEISLQGMPSQLVRDRLGLTDEEIARYR